MTKLYILCGIPFSGKSFLAKEIEKKFGHTRVDLDDVKFELYGENVKDEYLKQKDWDILYREGHRKVESLLQKGKTVVYDTGNFTKHERNTVRQIANRLGIEITTIFVDTPKQIAYERLSKNRSSN